MVLRRLLIMVGISIGCSTPPMATDVPDVPAVCDPNGATVIMGTGTEPTARVFRALEDGSEVVLTPGSQGSQHIWIGLRARGIDPTQPRIELKVYRASDDLLIGRLRVRLRMEPAPEDSELFALSSQTLIVEDDRYCSVLPGDIRVTLDFNDARGHCVRTERRLRISGLDPLALEIDREARARCCRDRLRRCFPDEPLPSSDAGTRLDAMDG